MSPNEAAQKLARAYAIREGKIESCLVHLREEATREFTSFAAEVQEEYRQKVRGQILKACAASPYFSHLALTVEALRDPEPEPSEAAMRVVRFFWPDCADYWAVQKARIVDEEFKKGAANPNA